MSTPEQMQQAWEAQGERAALDLHVFEAEIDLVIAKTLRDTGLARWAVRGALERMAKNVDQGS